MTSRHQPLHLADDLPGGTAERWRELVDTVLRRAGTAGRGRAGDAGLATGATARFEATMVSRTDDGFAVQPLYDGPDTERLRAAGWPGVAPFVRGRRGAASAVTGWEVCQRVDVGRPERLAPREVGGAATASQGPGEAAGYRARDEVDGGATALWLGVPAADAELLDEALAGVDLATVTLRLDASDEAAGPRDLADAVIELWRQRGVDPAKGRAILAADPLGRAAVSGRPLDAARLIANADGAAAAAAELAVRHPGIRAFVADGLPYHRAGASDGEELGCALATGVTYLRAMVAAGLDVSRAFEQLEVRVAASTDQFATIAKLRAGRRLWARVGEVLAVGSLRRVPPQHAVTSPAMLTAYSPWSNLVRTTIACFAAGVGGADAVTVLPHDWAATAGASSQLARRLARNVQLLLLEEAGVARVVDPAGGSGYVEALTDQVARAAWTWFQELEAAGGMPAALAEGVVEARVASTWEARAARLATGAEVVTGINDQADLLQPLPPGLDGPAGPEPSGLAPRRVAAAFERQRARADRHRAATGERPTVVLATLGAEPVAEASSLAVTLLGLGGLAPFGEMGDVAVAVSRLRSGQVRVACLCPDDRCTPGEVRAAAARLREAGAACVLLAGRPGEWDGIDDVLHDGCDRLGVISRALDAAVVA